MRHLAKKFILASDFITDELAEMINNWINNLFNDVSLIKQRNQSIDPYLAFFIVMKLYCDDMLIDIAKEYPDLAEFIKTSCTNLSNEIKTIH